MDREKMESAFEEACALAKKQGGLTFDDLLDFSVQYSLSYVEQTKLTDKLFDAGISIFDQLPELRNPSVQNSAVMANHAPTSYEDFAQSDYEALYSAVVEKAPSLKVFVDTVRRILPPQRHEVARLAPKIKAGDRLARKRMIEMYLRGALRYALQREKNYDMPLEEALGEACIGLIMAVDRYDFSKGPFASYCGMWMMQNVVRYQRTRRPLVYYPAHTKEVYFRAYPFLKKRGCLECERLRTCKKALAMVKKALRTDKENAEKVITAMIPDESFDLDDETRFPLQQDWELEESVWASEIKGKVCAALKCLTDREALVIRLRYGFDGAPMTLDQVGLQIGVTRERVRQIEKKGIVKLKKAIEIRANDGYDQGKAKKGDRGEAGAKIPISPSVSGREPLIDENKGNQGSGISAPDSLDKKDVSPSPENHANERTGKGRASWPKFSASDLMELFPYYTYYEAESLCNEYNRRTKTMRWRGSWMEYSVSEISRIFRISWGAAARFRTRMIAIDKRN